MCCDFLIAALYCSSAILSNEWWRVEKKVFLLSIYLYYLNFSLQDQVYSKMSGEKNEMSEKQI